MSLILLWATTALVITVFIPSHWPASAFDWGVEYTFSRYESGAKLVVAIGVMFTVAGENDIRAIYPNISFKYFFEQN